jgi:DNA-binding transcriptional ArsR family regulator
VARAAEKRAPGAGSARRDRRVSGAGDRARARLAVRSEAREGAVALDRLIHERVRLALVSALASQDALTHNELKAQLRTSDGNLSVHARKLEEAGYVAAEKRFEGRVPRTRYRLTERGRRAFERYLAHMEALIRVARGG